MRPLLLLTLRSISSFAAGRPDPFQWRRPFAPRLAVEIRGLNGDVHAEFSSGTEVAVYAQVTGAERVHADVIHQNGGGTVRTVSRSHPKQCSHQVPAAGDDASINCTVRVPRAVGLIGRTVNGEVEAQNLHRGVNAETVNGKIQISTSGKAQPRTVHGDIVANCSMKPATRSTVTGSITLKTSSLANAPSSPKPRNGGIATAFRISGHRSLSRAASPAETKTATAAFSFALRVSPRPYYNI